ncbi:MAG TPA: glycosyltransferase family 4 protein [Alphaproteobacteria bacterium]|nr:glycosyltransferase family 4 protein [Alphaproteobacteria bacterium]
MLHFVVPGAIGQTTGGYIYDRRMVEGLRNLGWRVVVHELAGRFPDADAPARRAARDALARIGADRAVIDGLALLAFDGSFDQRARWPVVALVHHPLARESGLDAARRRRFAACEPRIWRRLAGVIATSGATRHEIVCAGVAAARAIAVEPGVARRPHLRPFRRHGIVILLAVGAIIPRKGHGLLLAALAGLRRRRWRLLCLGSEARDRAHAARLRAAVRLRRLARRVRFAGEAEPRLLERAYASAHVFTLPSLHEGYGMAFADALAQGLPVVTTRAGALADLVPAAAGALVRPNDTRGLRRALRRLLEAPRRRSRMRRGALATARRFSDWPDQARRFAGALVRLAP